ncbi:DUF927 domain-containing protein [Shewanella algae]|uniref:DUF927 domain-containing protein n=1 Tax=Shewanella algae TaxID=38313 RepID=UPI0031F50D0C
MNDINRFVMSSMSPCPDISELTDFHKVDDNGRADMGQDSDNLDVLSEQQRPFFKVFNQSGTWGKAGVYLFSKGKPGSAQPKAIRICAPLKVVARVRDIDSDSWGKLLEWTDPDGIKKLWSLQDSLLVGDPTSVLGPLANGGLEIIHKYRREVLHYLSITDTEDRAICVNKTGWIAPSVYVSCNHVVNSADDTKYLYQEDIKSHTSPSSGTLANWQQQVANLCVGNSRLMFAGPLLTPLGFSGGGFHFQGCSSIIYAACCQCIWGS